MFSFSLLESAHHHMLYPLLWSSPIQKRPEDWWCISAKAKRNHSSVSEFQSPWAYLQFLFSSQYAMGNYSACFYVRPHSELPYTTNQDLWAESSPHQVTCKHYMNIHIFLLSRRSWDKYAMLSISRRSVLYTSPLLAVLKTWCLFTPGSTMKPIFAV